ncbi:MAG: hypothetical protein IT343_10780 [Candidatus Melainabacteria bacterium]|jgi:hypothetical protein|nr:hypothetical protein [Candidatus Melainabacteria bacterium]
MFQSNDIFSSQNQGYAHDASLNFVPQPQIINRYSLDIDRANAVRLAEIFVEHDSDGAIRAANYDSGAQVRKHELYTVVKAANNSLWMGDRFGGWHPID